MESLQNEKGKIGEQLVSNFFDLNFSKFFSFPNPLTKSNAEVADVLIWLNKIVFLIEVKTRDTGSASIESWASSKIKEAIAQIRKNYCRIKDNEIINLHNTFYQTQLDSASISEIIGLILLVHDENFIFYPTESDKNIYNYEIPIHVLSWNDLQKMIKEIDTTSDFYYYLNDRFNYLRFADIPLGSELNVLGYYKTHSNKFPKEETNFFTVPYWEIYSSTMSDSIKIRNEHNKLSIWIDALESYFSSHRRLLDGIPLGLYFAWEIGKISRRERAHLGEKLDTVQEYFEAGNSERVFAVLNTSTGNWLVFYFSRNDELEIQKKIFRLTEFKLIKEVHENSFNYGVYGFGYKVSNNNPPRLIGLSSAVVLGADCVKDKYTKEDLEQANSYFSDKESRITIKIKEFPKS